MSGPTDRAVDVVIHRRRPNLPAVVVLTVVWLLLWDGFSVFLLLTGVLLALAVGLVFPLPAIERHGRIRPLALLQLVVRLAADVVRSSVAVIAQVFARGTPRSSIIRVQLRSRSDLYLTQTVELVSLVPGSLVIEARRSTSTLYLHVLGVSDEAGLEQAVQDVLDAEARVLRAFGSPAEIEALDAGRSLPDEAAPGAAAVGEAR